MPILKTLQIFCILVFHSLCFGKIIKDTKTTFSRFHYREKKTSLVTLHVWMSVHWNQSSHENISIRNHWAILLCYMLWDSVTVWLCATDTWARLPVTPLWLQCTGHRWSSADHGMVWSVWRPLQHHLDTTVSLLIICHARMGTDQHLTNTFLTPLQHILPPTILPFYHSSFLLF